MAFSFGILGYQQFYNQTYKAGISVVAIPISGPQDYAAAVIRPSRSL